MREGTQSFKSYIFSEPSSKERKFLLSKEMQREPGNEEQEHYQVLQRTDNYYNSYYPWKGTKILRPHSQKMTDCGILGSHENDILSYLFAFSQYIKMFKDTG